MSRSLKELTPATRELCNLTVEGCRAAGVALLVTCTGRTRQEQAAAWAVGRTVKIGSSTITQSPPGTGKHEKGEAFDIVPMRDGVCVWDVTKPENAALWEQVGKIGESVGLTWGGRWKQRDYSHFELKVEKMTIDKATMDKAAASVATVEKVEPAPGSKLPTLKSATAALAVTALVAALPAIAMVFPQVTPFIGAINAIAKLFGYGA